MFFSLICHTNSSEFQTENNLKLHSKEILFSKHLNNHSNKFQQTIKDLLQSYEQLKTEYAKQQANFHSQTKDIENQYQTIENHVEAIFENEMMKIVC